jgi:hypothetical protein
VRAMAAVSWLLATFVSDILSSLKAQVQGFSGRRVIIELAARWATRIRILFFFRTGMRRLEAEPNQLVGDSISFLHQG